MKIVLNIVTSIAFLLFAINLFSYRITGREFDESSIYQIVYGFEALNFWAFIYILFAIVVSFFTLIFILIFFHRLPIVRKLGVFETSAIILVFAVYISMNAVTTKVFHVVLVSLGNQNMSVEKDFSKRFEAVPANTTLKKSVVFVYLESFERTFLDDKLFPGLAPNIARIEKRSDHFTEIAELASAGWTMGGMVSSQCGFPLVTPIGSGNSMGRVGSFLSGANCLGDIMRSNGYRLEFLGGAPKQFAGKDKFYTTHGFHSIKGLDELRREDELVSEWGRHDDKTLQDVIVRYQELLSAPQPFGLFALTLDTHSPNGYISSSCGDAIYLDGSNAMLNAVHCNDKIVGQFIESVMAVPGGENTLFVIASDHLAMKNTASQILESGNRRNLFMVFDGRNEQGRSFDKRGTTLDIGATVMDYLTGGKVVKMGLGRSLRNPDVKTLVMLEKAAEAVDRKLTTWRQSLLSFWQFATSIENGIQLRPHQEIAIGHVVLAYPVVLELDGKNIKDIILDDSIDKFSNLVFMKKQGLLIDNCSNIDMHLGRSSTALGTCYIYAGRRGKLLSGVMDEFFNYDIKQLMINGSILDSQEMYRLDVVAQTGAYPENFYVSDGFVTDADLKIMSSGFETGSVSTIQLGDQILSYQLERGLNFVGFDKNGKLSVLGNVDLCTGNIEHLQSLRSKVRQSGQKVLIIASDTLYCGVKDQLREVFDAFGLQKWEEVDYRAPYVAIIQNNNLNEYIGRRGARLSVWSSVPNSFDRRG